MHCVFVPFSRSRGQTAGRRWVWRVIPLHLSINPETISSVPLQNVKASLSRRWVHHPFSKTFPRVSIKTHKHIMCHYFLLPSSLPFCHSRAAAVSECSWVGYVVCSTQNRSSVWKLQDVTGSSLCRWHHSVWVVMGHVPEISCLIGSETLKEMTLPQLPSLSLCQRELGSPITPALAN